MVCEVKIKKIYGICNPSNCTVLTPNITKNKPGRPYNHEEMTFKP
jgi:hypothetical protein